MRTVWGPAKDDSGVRAGGCAHGTAGCCGAVRQVRGGALAGVAPRQAQLPHLQHQQRPQRLSQVAACRQAALNSLADRQLTRNFLDMCV